MSRQGERRSMMRVAGQDVPRPPGLGRDDFDDVRHRLIPALAQWRPSVAIADAVLKLSFARPVGIDPETLQQTSDPLETAAEIYDHFSANDDGCGLLTGSAFFAGSTVVAVEANPASAWESWRVEHGSELRQPTPQSEYRMLWDIADSVFITHQRPPRNLITTRVFGEPDDLASWDDLADADEQWRSFASSRPGWVIWRLGGDFRWKARKLGDGVTLLGPDSSIPFYVQRGAGGLIRGSTPRTIEQLPPWLAAKFGVRQA